PGDAPGGICAAGAGYPSNRRASSPSTSSVVTTNSSSPPCSGSCGCGTRTRPSRRIATSDASAGHWIEPTCWPASGASAGMVSSTRLASLCPKVISLTRSPTLTASSTSADSSRGVETATSTPHDSLYSHSLPGWLTRATTRGTPYSVLASSATTRLTLSSPVAATTTSQRSSPASYRERISHASASSHSALGTLSTLIARGAWSISSTSCPLP